MTPEDIEAYLAHHGYNKDRDVVEVWEEHVAALEVFQRCQFNTVVLAGETKAKLIYLGIPALEVESATRALGYEFTGDLLDEVQTIARAAAAVMNERK